jgi:hypothetical protein
VEGFTDNEEVVVLVGQSLTFDASGSCDDDGTTLTYGWDFGDGYTDAGEVVSHAYESGGSYTVELTVLDSDHDECNEDCEDHWDTATRDIRVLEVGLEAIATGNTPDLENGRMCFNAQEEYKKAKWKAIVKGDGTARVSSTGDVSVGFAGIDGSDPSALADGDEFWVNSPSEPGTYEITIVHNDLSACTGSDGELVFRFVYCLNSSTVPSVRQASSGEYTDTSAGGEHDGGYAKLEWASADTDSVYLEAAGIGDLANDCQPGIGGEATNNPPGPPSVGSGQNGVEFHAGVHEIGNVQVGTIPKDVFGNGVRIEADMGISATWKWSGYPGTKINITIGGSLGIIKFGISEAMEFSGGTVCAGGIGMYWDGVCLDHVERIEREYSMSPYMIGGEEMLDIPTARVSGEGVLPLEISYGFSGGVAACEKMTSDLITCRSILSGMDFTFENEEYTIISGSAPGP